LAFDKIENKLNWKKQNKIVDFLTLRTIQRLPEQHFSVHAPGQLQNKQELFVEHFRKTPGPESKGNILKGTFAIVPQIRPVFVHEQEDRLFGRFQGLSGTREPGVASAF
jgi:hypothetical protein